MLEANAEGKNPYKALEAEATGQKLFTSEREEVEETMGDARLIMRDYFDYYEDDELDFVKLKGKKAEHQAFVEIAPGIELEVRLDAIAESKKYGRILVENKTFKHMPSDDHRWRDVQSNIYKEASDRLKLNLNGTLWNYIRSKSPTMPQLLKDGGVSQKRLDTLPSALALFEKEQKLRVPERLKIAAIANRRAWFQRTVTSFRKATVTSIVADFIESAKEMSQFLGVSKAKSIDRHCDYCEFESICRAELTGGDAKFIIKKEFTNREQREEIEEVG